MKVKEYLDWLIPFTECENGAWCDYDEEYNPKRKKEDLKMMWKLQSFQHYLFLKTSKKLSDQAYKKACEENCFCVGCQPFSYKGKFYIVGEDNGQGSANWIKTVDFETIGEYGGFILITKANLEEEF